MTIDYRRAFKIACDLLNGDILYGVDASDIYELMMQKDGVVSSSSYEEYILNHLQELAQGQYASGSENPNKSEIPIGSTTKNDLGVDCIVDVLGSYTDLDIPYKREIAENILTKLFSVTPRGMTIKDRNNKLKHFITCLKCEISGKCCDDNCSTQYDAGNMGEIIKNLEAISKALEQEPILDKISAEIAEYGSIWVEYKITGRRDKDIEQLVSDVLSQAKKQVLEVIDKYKAESEPQESEVEDGKCK